jgi:hypothetical protein
LNLSGDVFEYKQLRKRGYAPVTLLSIPMRLEATGSFLQQGREQLPATQFGVEPLARRPQMRGEFFVFFLQ